jgi:hypothetical protein
MVAWYSVYFPLEDYEQLATRLRDWLIAAGYTPFNPFGLMPGRVYRDAARAFIAPPRDGWTRMIAEKPFSLPPCPLIVAASLEGAPITTYVDGVSVDPAVALADYPGISDALTAPISPAAAPENLGGVPFAALPADARKLAAKIDPAAAGKLFDRLSANVLGKVGGDAADAGALLAAADWNSVNGERIRRVMACLRLSAWRDPDFITLRDAYALHERRRRTPNAPLYPGDAETLNAVPNALDYRPLYAGRE